MDSPTISVVMSVFNGEAFLREAVESILAQTFRDFEFIIIDDGSRDTTPQILAEYAKRDVRVIVLSQTNMGRAASLNRGLALAQAPLIARMDADDVSLADRLEQQLDFLDSHPEVGLLSGAFEITDVKGTVLAAVHLPLDDLQIRAQMLQRNCMCHPAIAMRRDVALASGGYRKQLRDADDYDLWLRMAERTRLANLDVVLLKYRVHEHQASIRNTEHQTWCILAARTAASFRADGRPDPLCNLKEVTRSSVLALGVNEAEAHQLHVSVQKEWVSILQSIEPELAIRANASLVRLSKSDSLGRRLLADLWLRVAAGQFKQGRVARALFSVARGLAIRPVVAGRPAKKLLIRLGGTLKNLMGPDKSPESP
jgi:hypothetical protein